MKYLPHLHSSLKQHLLKELNEKIKVVTSVDEYNGILLHVERYYISLIVDNAGVLSVVLIPIDQIIDIINFQNSKNL